MTSSSKDSHFSPSDRPLGSESLSPEEFNTNQSIIKRVDFTFQQHPATGLGKKGGDYLKEQLLVWQETIKSISPKEKLEKLEKTEKIAWNLQDELIKMFPNDEKESETRLRAIMKEYNPNGNKTLEDIAKKVKETYDQESKEQKNTHLYKTLIQCIQQNAETLAIPRVTKICAFGGWLIAHPSIPADSKLKRDYDACTFQHAAVFEIQKILEGGEGGRKVPITFQDPAYTVLDKEVVELLGKDSNGGATVVEDKIGERKPWLALDENTFYISLQASIQVNRLVFELTKPAVFLYDSAIMPGFFNAPPQRLIALHGEFEQNYKIPFTGAFKYNFTKFQFDQKDNPTGDYERVVIPFGKEDLGPNEKVTRALGRPHLYLRRK